jgi:hypothetical protein
MCFKTKYDRRGHFDCHRINWNGYKDIEIQFFPIKYWRNIWKFNFFGWDCPILHIETPWVSVSMDLRAKTPSAIRDFRE